MRSIIAGRGMISAATIDALEAKHVDYILVVRERATGEVREDVLDDDGIAVPLTIARQRGQTQLAVQDVKLATPRSARSSSTPLRLRLNVIQPDGMADDLRGEL
jgi:hypothetical protein